MTKLKLFNALTLALLLPTIILPVSKAQAAVRCETQYGGGQVCVKTGNLQVNKQIQGSDGNWYDNFGQQSSVRFKNGDVLTFRMHVTNVGDAMLGTVQITDTLPGELKLVDGSLTPQIQNLDVGSDKAQDVFVKAQVVGANNTINCNVYNTAEVRSGDQYDKDQVQVCLQNGSTSAVTPTTLPKSGPEDTFAIISVSLLAASTGMFLLKTAKARL